MKNIYINTFFLMFVLSAYASKVTITNSGNTFSPSSVTINAGDTVVFQLETAHNVVEVSQSTYIANGNTSNGGFSLPFGGGSVKLSQAGTYYYVCTPHAKFGMKGIITVNQTAGVEDIKSRPMINIYHNSAFNTINVTLNIKNKTSVDYLLINQSGKMIYKKNVIYSTPGVNEELIEPNIQLSKGIYLLAVQTKEGFIATSKILIRDK
jgi:plastocyanin